MTDQFIKPVKAKKPSKKKAIKYTSSRIFFVLDMSGSMHSVWDDTIGGFNAFLEEQKACTIPTTLTLVLFDDQYEVLYNNVPIDQVEPLTKQTYRPRGSTAMFDAIGKTIAYNRTETAGQKTVLAILTDGQESPGFSGSKEYNRLGVKAMIEEVQNQDWEVLFVGANIDAAVVGGGMGVHVSKTASFHASGKGVQDVMKSAAYASNVSRGMSYDWMEVSGAANTYAAGATNGLNMNTLYASVAKGEDEQIKTQVLNEKK